jgi:hypothetical protein
MTALQKSPQHIDGLANLSRISVEGGLARHNIIIKILTKPTEELKELHDFQVKNYPFQIVTGNEIMNFNNRQIKFIAIDPRKKGPERFLGYASVSLNQGTPELEKLSVSVAQKRQRIGARLMGNIISYLIRKKYKKIQLRTSLSAAKFYKQLGFVPSESFFSRMGVTDELFLDFKTLEAKRRQSIARRNPPKVRFKPTPRKLVPIPRRLV